jgi:hypothetical protein
MPLDEDFSFSLPLGSFLSSDDRLSDVEHISRHVLPFPTKMPLLPERRASDGEILAVFEPAKVDSIISSSRPMVLIFTSRLLREGQGYTRDVCSHRLVFGFRNRIKSRKFCAYDKREGGQNKEIRAIGVRRQAKKNHTFLPT